MGPVIDQAAFEKISGYIRLGEKEATLAYQGNPTAGGFYIAPNIFSEVAPTARIAREEIFGPVVCLMPAEDLTEAIKIANGVPYDLTGGVFSKNRAVIDRIKRELNVGNLYINRKITGALVACQPFGGYRLSSLGFKAGGPEYLYQFLKDAPPPPPPLHRELPSAPFQASDKNELVYKQEGNRWLSKTICERN